MFVIMLICKFLLFYMYSVCCGCHVEPKAICIAQTENEERTFISHIFVRNLRRMKIFVL